MSIITRFLSAVTEPEFKLARDLTAMAIADGQGAPSAESAPCSKDFHGEQDSDKVVSAGRHRLRDDSQAGGTVLLRSSANVRSDKYQALKPTLQRGFSSVALGLNLS